MKLFLLLLPMLWTTASAFTVLPPKPNKQQHATFLCMAKVGVFFGTSTGSTEEVADMLVEKLGADGPFDVDEGDSILESFRQYDSLIVGTPTWNTGADVERSGTGWDELYYGSMENLQLTGKKVAVFGLGDSVSYAENYADAAGELHDVFEKLGCQMFGYVSQEGYLHEDSKSIRGDKFCGLLLDAVNQEELTEERVDKWVEQLTQEGFLEGGAASVDVEQVVPPTPALVPDSPMADTTPLSPMDVMMAEQQTAQFQQQLDEKSTLLDESIAIHNSGYVPHTNAKTGRTMWTSPDGRTCYFTDATVASSAQSTSVSP